MSSPDSCGSVSGPISLVRVEGLDKAFSVPVLTGFEFDLQAGEVHALVGSNGAGKSTFANILCGLLQPSAGSLFLAGRPYTPANRQAAGLAGVVMVMQELNVIPTLSVAENLFFDKLPHKLGWIDRARLAEKAREALGRVGLDGVDPEQPAGTLGMGHQQLVEIAGALARDCRVLILDEPTAALTDHEIDQLFKQIRRLQGAGVGILYISHRMGEILELADRTTVLRDGRRVATYTRDALSIPRIIEDMSGKALAAAPGRPRGENTARKPAFEAHAVSSAKLRSVTLSLHHGEILGLAGLVGSGRTEFLRACFGADPVDSGSFMVDGRPVQIRNPAQAVAVGIGLVPEDRKTQGLLLPRAVRENATLADLSQFSRHGFLNTGKEVAAIEGRAGEMELRCASYEQPIGELSGGNQQKVMMLRWLLRGSAILLLDEPTRGIDVSAKAVIYRLLRELADRGKAVLMVSSELPELMAVCDRISVMSNGRLAGIFERHEFDEAAITAAAFRHYLEDSP